MTQSAQIVTKSASTETIGDVTTTTPGTLAPRSRLSYLVSFAAILGGSFLAYLGEQHNSIIPKIGSVLAIVGPPAFHSYVRYFEALWALTPHTEQNTFTDLKNAALEEIKAAPAEWINHPEVAKAIEAQVKTILAQK